MKPGRGRVGGGKSGFSAKKPGGAARASIVPRRLGDAGGPADGLFDRVRDALRVQGVDCTRPGGEPDAWQDAGRGGNRARTWSPNLGHGGLGALVQEIKPTEDPVVGFGDKPDASEEEAGSRSSRPSFAASLQQSLHMLQDAGERESKLAASEGQLPWYIIDPNWPSKVKWDIWLGLLIIYSVLSIPYHLAFDQPATGGWESFNYTVDGFFILDLALCFFTSVTKENGELVDSLLEIQVTYLKGWFLVDFASCFPFDKVVTLATGGGSNDQDLRSLRIIRVVRLTRLLKLARLFKISRVLASIEEQLRIPNSLIKLLKLFGNVVIFMHYISCLWFVIGCPDGQQLGSDGVPIRCGADKRAALPHVDPLEDTWVLYYDVHDFPAQQQYLVCFYWVATTIMGVGYGDVTPRSGMEKVLSILVMLLGATFFGLILGQITAMIQNINPRAAEQKKRLGMVRDWMFQREVPKIMRRKVRAHYDYMFSRQVQQTEGAMLDQVPERMKTSLARTMHHSELATLRFLQRPASFTTKVVFQLRPFVASVDEAVVEQHDACFDFYMVMSGVVVGVDGGIREERTGSKEARPSVLQVGRTMANLSERIPALSGRFGAFRRGSEDMTSPIKVPRLDSRGVVRAIYAKGDHFAEGAMWRQENSPLGYTAATVCDLLFLPRAALVSTLEIETQVKLGFEAQVHNSARLIKKALAEKQLFVARDSDLEDIGWKLSRRIVWQGELVPEESCPNDGPDLESEPVEQPARGVQFDVVDADPDRFATRVVQTLEAVLPSDVKDALGAASGEVGEQADEHSDLLAHMIIPQAHPRKVLWDMFVACLIVYSAIIIPFRIGFSQPGETADAMTKVMDGVIDALFGLDILVSFRTSFTDPKSSTTVKDTALIRKNYLTGWFCIDFFSTVPFDRIAEAVIGGDASAGLRSMRLIKMARLFRLLKLVRLLKMMKLLTIIQRNIDLDPMVWQLIKLAINMIGFAHLIGCFWFLLTHQVEPNPGEWDEARGGSICERGRLNCHSYEEGVSGMDWWGQTYGGEFLEPQFKDKQFMASFYWAFTTMTTVGYGDITPVGMAERIYSIVTMFLGATLFGYTVGSIASILEKRTGADAAIQKRVKGFKDFLTEGTTAVALLNPIVKDYEFRQLSGNTLGDADSIFGELSPQVRTQLAIHVYSKVLSRISLFAADTVNESVAAYLVPLLRPQLYVEGDTMIPPYTRLTALMYVSEGVAEELEAERKFRAQTTRPVISRSRHDDVASWQDAIARGDKVEAGEAFYSGQECADLGDKSKLWYRLSRPRQVEGWVPAFDLPEDLPSAPRIGDPGCGPPKAKLSDDPVIIEEPLTGRRMFVRGMYWPGEHSLLSPDKIKFAAHGVLTTPTFVRSATPTVATYSFDLGLLSGSEGASSLPKRITAHIVQSVADELAKHDEGVTAAGAERLEQRQQDLMQSHSEKDLATIEQPDWAVKAGIDPRVWGGTPIPARAPPLTGSITGTPRVPARPPGGPGGGSAHGLLNESSTAVT